MRVSIGMSTQAPSRAVAPRPLLALLPLLAGLAALLLPAATAGADSLLITEAVVDPQSDHSESAGGNGVPYDGVPGNGTVSTVDEFLEIYNAGPAAIDLTLYRLEFLDTTPDTLVLGSAGSVVLRFSSGSSIRALLPGGFVIIGNPPGSMNNLIEILLRAGNGTLLDRLSIANGAAQGPGDEAVARVWDGLRFLATFVRAPISPLGPTASAPAAGGPSATPTPEVGTLATTALILLLAARSSARRARRASRRRSDA